MVVFADTIKIDCPDKTGINDVFSCDITGTSSDIIIAISAKIGTSDGISFVSFKPDSVWSGDGAMGDIELYTADDITGEFNIGTVNFKTTTDSGVVSVKDVTFYTIANQKNVVKTVTSETEVDENVKSSKGDEKVYLADLIIDKYKIDFKKDVFEYKVKINDDTELGLLPILEDITSDYTVEGNKNLENGSVVKIIVKNGSNETTYKILIEKEVVEKKNYGLIFIIIIVIIVIINIVRILMKKRKKK